MSQRTRILPQITGFRGWKVVGSTNDEKADRLAWAAMQKAWQDAAVRERLSKCTDPPDCSTSSTNNRDCRRRLSASQIISYAMRLNSAFLAVLAISKEALSKFGSKPATEFDETLVTEHQAGF